MKVLDNLVRKVSSIPVEILIREIVEDNKALIEDKNAEQMYRGEMPDGSSITPPYASLTLELKKLKGQPVDRVTLKDEGSFYAGIKLNLDSDSFTIDNTDPKTEKLINKYGEVLGLGRQARQEVTEEILRPHIIDKARRYLGV